MSENDSLLDKIEKLQEYFGLNVRALSRRNTSSTDLIAHPIETTAHRQNDTPFPPKSSSHLQSLMRKKSIDRSLANLATNGADRIDAASTFHPATSSAVDQSSKSRSNSNVVDGNAPSGQKSPLIRHFTPPSHALILPSKKLQRSLRHPTQNTILDNSAGLFPH